MITHYVNDPKTAANNYATKQGKMFSVTAYDSVSYAVQVPTRRGKTKRTVALFVKKTA